MKPLFSMVLVLALSTSASALAAGSSKDQKPIQRNRVAVSELTSVHLDESFFGSEDVSGGHLVVDRDSRKITLTLSRPFACEEETFCPEVMPAPIVVEFSLTEVQHQACSEKVYVGIQSKKQIGQAPARISVLDRSAVDCASFGLVADLVVEIETEVQAADGSLQLVRSKLEGRALKPVAQR